MCDRQTLGSGRLWRERVCEQRTRVVVFLVAQVGSFFAGSSARLVVLRDG